MKTIISILLCLIALSSFAVTTNRTTSIANGIYGQNVGSNGQLIVKGTIIFNDGSSMTTASSGSSGGGAINVNYGSATGGGTLTLSNGTNLTYRPSDLSSYLTSSDSIANAGTAQVALSLSGSITLSQVSDYSVPTLNAVLSAGNSAESQSITSIDSIGASYWNNAIRINFVTGGGQTNSFGLNGESTDLYIWHGAGQTNLVYHSGNLTPAALTNLLSGQYAPSSVTNANLSEYLPKSGGTMTGSLHGTFTGDGSGLTGIAGGGSVSNLTIISFLAGGNRINAPSSATRPSIPSQGIIFGLTTNDWIDGFVCIPSWFTNNQAVSMGVTILPISGGTSTIEFSWVAQTGTNQPVYSLVLTNAVVHNASTITFHNLGSLSGWGPDTLMSLRLRYLSGATGVLNRAVFK